MGHKKIIPCLETVLNGDSDDEVKEAARETLNKLK